MMLKRWRRHVWLAQALYGPHVARVRVTAAWRDVPPEERADPDVPTVAAAISEISVADQQGRSLTPDLRLPHWQERLARSDLAVLRGAARDAAIAEALHRAFSQLGVIAASSETYRVDTPPAPRWPPLYVGGADHPFRPARDAELDLATWDMCASNAWEFFTTFAREVYGARAARVDVTGAWAAPDPEAWPLLDRQPWASAVAVVVADADGNRLAPDLRTPWWQEWHAQPEVAVMSEAERGAAMAQAVDAYAKCWPFMTREQDTFWVDRPPARRGPVLYVREPFEPLAGLMPRRGGP